MCHCNYTYGDLLFIQVCSDARPQHCSTGQGSIASLLCKTGSQHACATAITPMEICSSYRFALMQHHCTEALVRARSVPHCSMLLCKTGSQHACATAITPMEICSSYRCAVIALQHWSGQNSFPTYQCCSVKQAHSMLVPL